MKKIALLIVSVMLTLAACSSKGTSGPTDSATPASTNTAKPEQSAAASAKPAPDLVKQGLPAYSEKIAKLPETTLEIWMAADYADKKPIQDAVAEFSSVYPNIKIKMTGIQWGDIPNKIKLAVTGGTAPDMAHSHPFAMGAQGLAEQIDDLWKEWGEESKFLPGGIDDVTWGGKKYGVPIDVNTTFYLYNKKMFEEAGIKEPPKTFDELLDVSKKLTKADGSRYGFVTSASGWGFYGYLVSHGVDFLKYDGDKVSANLNDPKIVDLLKKYTELSTVHKVSPVPPAQARQTDHPVAMFGTGRAAAIISGPFDIARIKDEHPDQYPNVATAPIVGTEPGSTLGGGGLFVPKGAKNKEASFELMKWFISDKYAIRMAAEMGRHPVKAHLYENELYKDPLLKPFIDTLKHAKAMKMEAYPEANSAWGKAIRASFDGADVAKSLNEAQETAQKALEKAK